MFWRKLHLHRVMAVEIISHSCPTKPWGSSITENYLSQNAVIPK